MLSVRKWWSQSLEAHEFELMWAPRRKGARATLRLLEDELEKEEEEDNETAPRYNLRAKTRASAASCSSSAPVGHPVRVLLAAGQGCDVHWDEEGETLEVTAFKCIRKEGPWASLLALCEAGDGRPCSLCCTFVK